MIEGAKGSEIVQTIIRMMRSRKLEEIAADPADSGGLPASVRAPSALHRHHRQAGAGDDGVVYFDLVGHDLEGYNKFIPYYLFRIRSTPFR